MIKNTANLLNLQNLMKRDPQSYLEEFRQQQRHFMANLQIFQSSLHTASSSLLGANAAAVAPTAIGMQTGAGGAKQHKFHKDFGGLVTFLAHVAPCFKVESSAYAGQLLNLLTAHYEALDPPLRKTIVQAVILLQNRALLDRMVLLPILFALFKIQDKPLRLLLFNHIISDVKRINLKRTPGYLRTNSQLQNYMYTMLSDKTSPLAAKKSLDVMIDLWRRKIWNDEKTVHAIQNAAFSKDTKIKVTALRFFLGMTFYEEEEEEEEEEEKQTIRAKLSVTKTSMKGVMKKRKKREREMKRAQKKVRHTRAHSSA
jgi:protein SDA1